MGSIGFAEPEKASLPVFQLGSVYPDPAGILFPSPATAATVNPAALAKLAKTTAFQLALSPAFYHGESHGYFGSFARTTGGFGFGLGTEGSIAGKEVTKGAFVGLGATIDRMSLGITVRDSNIADSISPSVDLGIIFGKGTGFALGFVFYRMEQGPRVAMGLGFNAPGGFNVEANLILPQLTRLSEPGSNYIASFGGCLPFWRWAVFSRSTYYTGAGRFVQTAGIGYWLGQSTNIALQYQTSRQWTFGFTIQTTEGKKMVPAAPSEF